MSFVRDLKTVAKLVLHRSHGSTHGERLEHFYAAQADDYDSFRERLLKGRRELIADLPTQDGATWVDLGGGTGANVEMLGERLACLNRLYVVDLCPSLLKMAQARQEKNGWSNVTAVHGDATKFRPSEPADVVLFSYSLTMIPDWFAAIENAFAMLKPGGVIGVVDFYVAKKYPAAKRSKHSFATRNFWPLWFQRDNVFLCPDHLPYLAWRFNEMSVVESKEKIPMMPLVKVPVYRFLGSKP